MMDRRERQLSAVRKYCKDAWPFGAKAVYLSAGGFSLHFMKEGDTAPSGAEVFTREEVCDV